MRVPPVIQSAIDRLSPKQRQYAMLGGVMSVGVGALWAVFALSDSQNTNSGANNTAASSQPSRVTNIGVMAAGQQVNPVDQWVGTAGKKLAQYDADRQAQDKINADRKAFEDSILKRFAEFEQRQTAAANATPAPVASASPAASYPPSSALPAPGIPGQPPAPRPSHASGMPPGTPGNFAPQPDAPNLQRIQVAGGPQSRAAAAPSTSSGPTAGKAEETTTSNIDTYLPVSFTRGVLIGGLDAPTGGQSQSNPHPVLIRLEDNAVLPNRFRSDVKECFVVAAGYGDISAERAYLRTENLSCVRHDGSTLEVKIQGSVYGEDGKVGMRGRLITKQGQMLANALTAGIVSGIGQGFSQSGQTVTSSTFGTIATTSGTTRDNIERGMGGGVGRALDRLAQYYIRLAEQTFPVIEIDAGRVVDVVITKGVRIEGGNPARKRATSRAADAYANNDHYQRIANEEDY